MIKDVMSMEFMYEYLMRERDLALQKIDMIERALKIYPTTADLRKEEKRERLGVMIDKQSETRKV